MDESKLLQLPDLITSRADPKQQALETARGSSDGQHRHPNKRTHGRASPVDALSRRQARVMSRSWASSDHFIFISRSAAPVPALINCFRALRHPMGEPLPKRRPFPRLRRRGDLPLSTNKQVQLEGYEKHEGIVIILYFQEARGQMASRCDI